MAQDCLKLGDVLIDFDVLEWKDGSLQRAGILSGNGSRCRLRSPAPLRVIANGQIVQTSNARPGEIEFPTTAGQRYVLVAVR